MAANYTAGTAYFTKNGKSFALAADFAWTPSTPSREALMGQDGFHGFKVKPNMGKITVKLRDSDAVSVFDLGSVEGETIQVQLANGKTVIGASMTQVGEISSEAEDGTISVEFHGPDVREG